MGSSVGGQGSALVVRLFRFRHGRNVADAAMLRYRRYHFLLFGGFCT